MPYADKQRIKEYNHNYHLKNWVKRKALHLEWKRKRREKLASWLREYKSNLECYKCKETHPACLGFHHKNAMEKDSAVSIMISQGNSIETIMKEINKCEVLCRNCHSKEHYDARV